MSAFQYNVNKPSSLLLFLALILLLDRVHCFTIVTGTVTRHIHIPAISSNVFFSYSSLLSHNENQNNNHRYHAYVTDNQLVRKVKRCGNNWKDVLIIVEENMFFDYDGRINSTLNNISYKNTLCKVFQVLGRNKEWEEITRLYDQYNDWYLIAGNYNGAENSNCDVLARTEICRCAISALGMSGKSQEANKLLNRFLDDSIYSCRLPSIKVLANNNNNNTTRTEIISKAVLYNSAIAACRRSGDWQLALELLQQSESSIAQYNLTQSSMIQSTARAGYEAVLTVLAQNRRYREAIELLGRANTSIDVALCNMVLLACNKAGNHTVALSFLEDMMGLRKLESVLPKDANTRPNINSLGKLKVMIFHFYEVKLVTLNICQNLLPACAVKMDHGNMRQKLNQ